MPKLLFRRDRVFEIFRTMELCLRAPIVIIPNSNGQANVHNVDSGIL